MKYRQIGRHGGVGALRKVPVFLCLGGTGDSQLGLVVSQGTGGLWLGWDCYPARLVTPIFLILIIVTFFLGECF